MKILALALLAPIAAVGLYAAVKPLSGPPPLPQPPVKRAISPKAASIVKSAVMRPSVVVGPPKLYTNSFSASFSPDPNNLFQTAFFEVRTNFGPWKKAGEKFYNHSGESLTLNVTAPIGSLIQVRAGCSMRQN